MSTHRSRRPRPPHRTTWHMEADLPASDMTDRDEELAVYHLHDGDEHYLRERTGKSLKRLRREPGFVGIVITAARKARCPACAYKLDWRDEPIRPEPTPMVSRLVQ